MKNGPVLPGRVRSERDTDEQELHSGRLLERVGSDDPPSPDTVVDDARVKQELISVVEEAVERNALDRHSSLAVDVDVGVRHLDEMRITHGSMGVEWPTGAA